MEMKQYECVDYLVKFFMGVLLLLVVAGVSA